MQTELSRKGGLSNRPNYIGRYWHDTFFRAMGVVTSVCDRYGSALQRLLTVG